MKRLTYMCGGKWRLRIGDTEYSGKAVDRLAALAKKIGLCYTKGEEKGTPSAIPCKL